MALQLEVNESRLEDLKMFEEHFQPELRGIYYLGCARDITPSKAFPNSRVIYADIDPDAVEDLGKKGFEAYCVDATKFKPDGSIDAVILFNQVIDITHPISLLDEGGYVLCNDYHKAATQVRETGNFLFFAIVRNNAAGETFIDTENLEDCWKLVETDEEFRNAPFSWGNSKSYEQAARIVKNELGVEENILENYVGLREKALSADQIMAGIPYLRLGESPIFLENLPRKKGTVDDLFVFRKK